MGPQLITSLHYLGLFFSGMLAGIEAGIHYGVGKPVTDLTEKTQIRLRQALVLRLRVLVPAFFAPAAGIAMALAIIDGGTPGTWLRWAGLLSLLIWVSIRIVRTVPLNSVTLEWDPLAPPGNWRALVAASERFHIVGVWAAGAAFALFLAALAQREVIPT